MQPIQLKQTAEQELYDGFITKQCIFVEATALIAKEAARMRANYALKLPDSLQV